MGHGYGNQRRLTDQVSAAFVDYWGSGRAVFPSPLQDLIDYWRWFHVVKAGLAIALLVVLIVLGGRIWKTFLSGRHPHGPALAAVGSAVTVLSVLGSPWSWPTCKGRWRPARR